MASNELIARRNLSHADRCSNVVGKGMDLADVLLSAASAVPLIGGVCDVAKRILTSVREAKSKVDDLLESADRLLDVLNFLRLMAQNVRRIVDESSKSEVEARMRRLIQLLEQLEATIAALGQRGWLKKVWKTWKNVPSLSALDQDIKSTLEQLIRYYQLAHDAHITQLLQDRQYALEAAVATQVQHRMEETGETEEAAVAALESDPAAVKAVAMASGMSQAEFQEELQEFRGEMRSHLEQLGGQLDAMQQALLQNQAAVLENQQAMLQKFQQLRLTSDGQAANFEFEPLSDEMRKAIGRPAPEKAGAFHQSFIGKGAFGVVRCMRGRLDRCLYAVKMQDMDGLPDGKSQADVHMEAAQLAALRGHPHIVQYFHAFEMERGDTLFFCIAMELLAGGSLARHIRSPPPSLQDAKEWMRQVASALAYMHARKLQHRDLKPENVLLDAARRTRIVDLGLACSLSMKSCVSTGRKAGTDMYMSPEKSHNLRYDTKDDVWAAGCILAGLLTGKAPWAYSGSMQGCIAHNQPALKRMITECAEASQLLGGVVAACLQKHARQRPTAHEVEQWLGQPLPQLGLGQQSQPPLATLPVVEEAAEEVSAGQPIKGEKAAAEKTAAEKAAKAAAEKAARPSAAAMANFFKKVGSDEQGVRRASTLYWASKELNDDDCEVIAYLIASGALANLTILALYNNLIGDEGIKAFSTALASGALANLTQLYLGYNQIGDAGIKIFSETVASGALANLTELFLGGNQIGDAGIKIFSETVASGALANLTELGLRDNQIGDDGIKIFAETVASGALANLTELYLHENKIGDEGIKTFSSALASGALAKLTEFYIDNKHIKNPHLVAACKPRGILIK